MIRRPPRSTLSSSSAASDVYKRQENVIGTNSFEPQLLNQFRISFFRQVKWCKKSPLISGVGIDVIHEQSEVFLGCLLYTSDAADEEDSVDLGGRRIIKKKKKKKK